MPCHGMLCRFRMVCPWCQPCFKKKTRQQQVTILSRNSAAGWEHLHRIRSHWSLKGLVCELPLSPQIERFTSDPQALLEARQATLSRSRCKVKELMPCVIFCQIPLLVVAALQRHCSDLSGMPSLCWRTQLGYDIYHEPTWKETGSHAA